MATETNTIDFRGRIARMVYTSLHKLASPLGTGLLFFPPGVAHPRLRVMLRIGHRSSNFCSDRRF